MRREEARLAIVGDIHGNIERLDYALEFLISSGRKLVFVGDYIDRGPDSSEVMQRLVDLANDPSCQATFLRGNHEAALLQWLDDGDMSAFVRHGGLTTIKSYSYDLRAGVVTDFPKQFPQSHRNFLSQTQTYLQTRELFISHAGFNPNNPAEREDRALVFGENGSPFDFVDCIPPRPLTIFGHFVQGNLLPRETDHLVCLDTGCGTLPDGRLTVLLTPERQYLQF